MAELYLLRSPGGLSPADSESSDYLSTLKQGEIVRADIVRPRNAKFHRKFFAMLDVGYDAWEPEAKEYKGQVACKNRERFRSDCLILAGFFEVVTNLRGEVRLEAKSISFAKMDQAEFEEVYSQVATVLLRKVLTTYSRSDLDSVVERMLGFV